MVFEYYLAEKAKLFQLSSSPAPFLICNLQIKKGAGEELNSKNLLKIREYLRDASRRARAP